MPKISSNVINLLKKNITIPNKKANNINIVMEIITFKNLKNFDLLEHIELIMNKA